MDYNKLAELIFPDITGTVDDLEARFPKRDLPEGAKVTRFAPSPTGYMHIGGLYAAMISRKLAKQSGGVFYLRIEDTDRKRELENGVEEKYIVIEGDGELAYCLNNETGEIVNWGLDNLEVYPEAESLESFVLAQFKEGKMNW